MGNLNSEKIQSIYSYGYGKKLSPLLIYDVDADVLYKPNRLPLLSTLKNVNAEFHNKGQRIKSSTIVHCLRRMKIYLFLIYVAKISN